MSRNDGETGFCPSADGILSAEVHKSKNERRKSMANYSCKETCGQEKPCGNRYCSANPKYVPPAPKKKGKKVSGSK